MYRSVKVIQDSKTVFWEVYMDIYCRLCGLAMPVEPITCLYGRSGPMFVVLVDPY